MNETEVERVSETIAALKARAEKAEADRDAERLINARVIESWKREESGWDAERKALQKALEEAHDYLNHGMPVYADDVLMAAIKVGKGAKP